MDFPIETIIRNDDGYGVIRLKVAAICACLDCDDLLISCLEEEKEPFFRTVEATSVTGEKYESAIDPHAFLYIQPTGNLAGDVEDVLDALRVSIDKGHLSTVFLKIGLDGIIDPVETWILTRDFYKWCVSRGFEHGDVCSDYDDGEFSIFDDAVLNANDRRKQLEAPYFDAEYEKRLGPKATPDAISKAEYEKILLENLVMRQGFPPEIVAEDRPLRTTERNVLLSIIAVLCKEAKLDYAKPAKSAVLIQDAADRMGVRIGESTIENHLKKISNALVSRMK